MNGAHLHLLVNHVSLFAFLMGTVVLGVSMKRKSVEFRGLATVLFLVGGIFAWIAFETGEQAEEVVKAVNSAAKPFIQEHEAAADWALRSGILVAVLSIGSEWAIRKRKRFATILQWTLFLLAAQGVTVFARTAFLGGLVTHVEVRK